MELDANVARLVEKLGAAFAIDARGADRHRYVNALLAIAAFLNEIKPLDIYADNSQVWPLHSMTSMTELSGRCCWLYARGRSAAAGTARDA